MIIQKIGVLFMEMSRYEDAYAEVLDIINHMEKELFDMIPLGFINMLKANMNSEYVIKIDYDIGINNQSLFFDYSCQAINMHTQKSNYLISKEITRMVQLLWMLITPNKICS